MFQMAAVFGELERSLIRERVMAGIARAKAQGKTLGRPMVGKKVEDAIRARLASRAGDSEGCEGARGGREHRPTAEGKPP